MKTYQSLICVISLCNPARLPLRRAFFVSGVLLSFCGLSYAQEQMVASPEVDLRMYQIIEDVSAERIEQDIRTLAGFGTRNTMSDTVSDTRGIGAARRWIKAEFDKISEECGGCLEVFYQHNPTEKEDGSRIVKDVDIVNVVAIQRGTEHPNRMIMMSGDIDSRASDATNYEIDAPGANDNASGMAGTIEAARVLTKYKFPTSIVYTGLAGEEQGLYGGRGLAEYAQENNWEIMGILNNDMIGNIEGVDGVIDNRSFRIFCNLCRQLKRKKNDASAALPGARLMVFPDNWPATCIR